MKNEHSVNCYEKNGKWNIMGYRTSFCWPWMPFLKPVVVSVPSLQGVKPRCTTLQCSQCSGKPVKVKNKIKQWITKNKNGEKHWYFKKYISIV